MCKASWRPVTTEGASSVISVTMRPRCIKYHMCCFSSPAPQFPGLPRGGILRTGGFLVLGGFGFLGDLSIMVGMLGIIDLAVGLVYLIGTPRALRTTGVSLQLDKSRVDKVA